VNEPSHRVTAHQPQQPQHYQYYSNRPQHENLLSLGHGFTALAASMVLCFVTLFTLSSLAAFFGLSFLDILRHESVLDLWGVTLPGIIGRAPRKGTRSPGEFDRPGRFRAIPDGCRAKSLRESVPKFKE
jgi:hypothetical protein